MKQRKDSQSAVPGTDQCPACAAKAIHEVYRYAGHEVLRCQVCRLDFVPENLVAQKGSSKFESSTTPEGYVDGYCRSIDQDTDAARRSLRLRIPIFEAAFGGKLSSVCEVGCSTGTGFHGFRERGIEWLGLETDPTWIELGRTRCLPILNLDLSDVDRSFDLIYLHQVLEHV